MSPGMFGMLCGISGMVFAIGIWQTSRIFWKPKSRVSWALRFSLWALIFFSFQLGGPFVRMLLGMPPRVGQPGFPSALASVLMLGFVGGVVLFPFGYLLSKRCFKP